MNLKTLHLYFSLTCPTTSGLNNYIIFFLICTSIQQLSVLYSMGALSSHNKGEGNEQCSYHDNTLSNRVILLSTCFASIKKCLPSMSMNT